MEMVIGRGDKGFCKDREAVPLARNETMLHEEKSLL